MKSRDIGDIIARDRARDSGVYENEPTSRREDLTIGGETVDNTLPLADGRTRNAISDWSKQKSASAPKAHEVIIDQKQGCISESCPQVRSARLFGVLLLSLMSLHIFVVNGQIEL